MKFEIQACHSTVRDCCVRTEAVLLDLWIIHSFMLLFNWIV